MLALINERVLAESDETGFAVALLPEGYAGSCQLEVQGRTGHFAVFPTVEHAESAARFAVGPLGGYLKAIVTVNTAKAPITHHTWEEWAFA